jgi:hypothetical protein
MIANITNATAGDDYVTIDSAAAAITAGDYDNGYLVIHDVGYMHKIRHSPAIGAAASGNIYLYDPIVAATTSNDCTFHKNPCMDVVNPSDNDQFTIGVPLIGVTASYYFWAQSWGPCGVNTNANGTDRATNRLMVMSASGVSLGFVGQTATTGAQILAQNMYDSTDITKGTYPLVFLQIMA